MSPATTHPEIPCAAHPRYRRRRPETTVLYRILADHLETFIERAELNPCGSGLPGWG